MKIDDDQLYYLTQDASFLRRSPANDAPVETELLFGEIFIVKSEEQGFYQGQALFDGYAGYIEKAHLFKGRLLHTHRLKVLRTFRYSEPNIKSSILGVISMNAKIQCHEEMEGRFVKDHLGGYIISDHLAPEGAIDGCPVSVAEKFIGTPYLWGGRQSRGLDCSALVQNAYQAVGKSVPRDSGPQEQYFTDTGEALFSGDGDLSRISLMRGDMVFWPGHVAMMVDEQSIIHANGTHMMVTIDPLLNFAGKVHDSDGPVRKIIRPR